MLTFKLDAGLPLLAFSVPGADGLVFSAATCPNASCPALHLDAVEVPAGTVHVDTAVFQGEDALHFVFNTKTGNLEAVDPAATTWLEADRGAWLHRWVAQHAEILRLRYAYLKGQQADGPADARPAPLWKPGTCIFHAELFPHDFTPSFVHEKGRWLIMDAYCPDPCCTCAEATLELHGPGELKIMVSGQLGNPTPKQTDRRSRALWTAINANDDLLYELGEREAEVRGEGPFIVGEAYERARLASRPVTTEPVNAGGYLKDGAVPVSVVERLFKLVSRLNAARAGLDAIPGLLHAAVREGPKSQQTWILASESTVGLEFYEDPEGDAPWLVLEVHDRTNVETAYRRQRCAHGWPLIGGTSLPFVVRYPADAVEHDAELADLRLAIAIGEALLVALPGLGTEPFSARRVFEHGVTVDGHTFKITLTASHEDAPWTDDLSDGDEESEDEPEENEADDEDLEEDDDDDGEDEEESPQERIATALAAFADAALERGVAPSIVTLAETLAEQLVEYVDNYGDGGPWYEPSTVERFVAEYLPSKVMLDVDDIPHVPEAMRALVTWLGEVGYVDANALGRVVDRALPAFQKRSQDPRQFSMAKALFAEMQAAGVEINSQTAIDRYLATWNGSSGSGGLRDAEPAKVLQSAPNRWKPIPGQLVPGPTAPCPCGSGRRYKKCCMPR